MRVLITGGNGYIAKSLSKGLRGCDITTVTREDVNLTDSNACRIYFWDKHYDVVIHTAVEGGHRLVSDNSSVIDNNILMYLNVYKYAAKYAKFINFGSGAELTQLNTPYGISKAAISQSMMHKDNCYNLRIFTVFDEEELKTRFIKANITNYINKQDLLIHGNKYMDFFYMEDLRTLVEYYIHTKVLPKQIDCCYKEKQTLVDIATKINSVGDHTSFVYIEDINMGTSYTGSFTDLGLSFIGLYQGIINTHNKLL